MVVLDTGLFTGHQPMTDAWKAFRDFVARTEDLPVSLLDRYLSGRARTGLMGAPRPAAAAGEGAVLTRLCPDADAARGWAAAQAELSARARAGKAVNLDASALVMDMLVTLAQVPAAHGQQGPT